MYSLHVHAPRQLNKFYIVRSVQESFSLIYMSAIAGQTARPNGLHFFRKPMGTQGIDNKLKYFFSTIYFFSSKFYSFYFKNSILLKFHGQRWAIHLVRHFACNIQLPQAFQIKKYLFEITIRMFRI